MPFRVGKLTDQEAKQLAAFEQVHKDASEALNSYIFQLKKKYIEPSFESTKGYAPFYDVTIEYHHNDNGTFFIINRTLRS